MAADKAQGILDEIAIDVKPDDMAMLKKIADTAMTGKAPRPQRRNSQNLSSRRSRWLPMPTAPSTPSCEGREEGRGSIEDSEIVEGMIIDKERVHPAMPALSRTRRSCS